VVKQTALFKAEAIARSALPKGPIGYLGERGETDSFI
jgi:hypothetical protein